MKPRNRLIVATLVLLALASVGLAATAPLATPARAQEGPDPVIISFTSDITEPVALSDVEALAVDTTLSWRTQGTTWEGAVRLDAYYGREWRPPVLSDAPLPANGSIEFTIEHPGNFGPPTFRLTIIDRSGEIIDERYIVLRYAEEVAFAQISAFSADPAPLTEAALADGTARLPVSWQVDNRPPGSNLSFEQELPDGRFVSIELPREHPWVPSSGQGELAPVLPEGESVLRIRARLYNVAEDVTLHERNLVLPFGEAAEGDQPVIQNFTVSPTVIDRGGEVVVEWAVSGAEVVLVGPVGPDGVFQRPDEPLPTAGSRSFAAGPRDFYTAEFFLYAGDAEGNGITTTQSVEVRCPYTFFFSGVPAIEATCPFAEAQTINAAYQIFEAGEMIWREDTQEITVLFPEGTYQVYPDTYIEGAEVDYPAGIGEPPEDYSLPIRGFGTVWAQNPTVRDQLGWAVALEVGFTMRVQAVAASDQERGYSTEYLLLPDNRLVALAPDNTWQQLPGAAIAE